MAKDQIYSSVIRLNTEDAQNKMEDLKKRVQDLVALRDTIDKKKDSGYYKSVSKQINAAKAELKVYENEVMKTIQTLDNLGNASAKDIRDAQKSLQKMIDAKPQGAEEMGDFVRRLQEVKQELQSIATMRAFDEVKAGITGTGKSAQQLGAEMRFLRETSENVGTASVQQLEKALEVAREHLKVAEQGSKAYERSTEYIRSFTAQLEKVKEEQRKSNTLIDRYNKELKEAGKEEKVVADEATLIKRTLDNISGASVRDLEYSIKALNEGMKDMDRSSDSYKRAEEKVKVLRTELEKTRMEAGAQMSAWGKFTKFLNDSWGGLTLLIGSLTGLSMTIRKTVQDYAEMEEAMADTRKYTGMSDAAIRDLNEDLKKMDTRTSREELNELAGAAGRLGKTSKKDILEFVEAGNMIKVALGDDLGEDAIDKVGKLAMAFGEDEDKGLRGAMLATGSAVNELAQNSSAQAGFLVDFTARVAGFGKQIGLTQAQIMGFGAVMDENLLRDEMAATAFGNMLTKMQTDTAKFANIAGMEVKSFTDLLNTDANAAILALADSLKKADPQNMMKMLDDMGLDGSRAVAVLATMADKIDDVRDRQELASKAYSEAVSVGKEYETMNNTVEAGIDKCKKQFHEMTVELGEKLVPVVQLTISSTSLLIRGLKSLIDFVSEHKILIIALAVEIAALNAKRLYGITLSKLEVIWNGKVATSIKAIGTAIKANPWGLAITAITAFIALLTEAAAKTSKNAKEMDALSKAHNRAADEFDDERTKIELLSKQVHDSNLSYETRKEKLDELKKIVPDYLADLDKEKGLVNDNTDALTAYLEQLEKSIKMKAAQEELEETYRKKRKLKKQESQLNSDLSHANLGLAAAQFSASQNANKLGTSGMRNLSKGTDIATKNAQARVNNVKDQLKDVHEQLSQTEKDITDLNDEITTTSAELSKIKRKKTSDSETESGTTPYESENDRKKREREQREAEADNKKKEAEERKRRKEAEDAAKAESESKLATKTHEYAMGKITYRQYILDMEKLQLEGLQKRRDVYEKGSVEYEKLNRQIEELNFKGSQQMNQMKLEDLQRCMRLQQLEIEAQAAREEITEDEKQERLRTLNESFLADKVELYKEGTLERMNAEWELEQTEERNRIEREKEYQQQLDQVRQQYLGISNEKMLQTALDELDKLHEKGLIEEEEYQRARIAIQAQYAGTQSPTEQTQNTANDMLTNARNAAAPTESASPIVGTIQNYQTLMEKLKELYGDDEKNHAAYLLAKQQATSDFCEKLSQEMQVAYQQINQVMQAASSYFSAQQEYETALVQKKYEKQIAAAGNNQKKIKKLQEKQQKEEAAIKSKYNKRQMVIQMAQAIGQTAVNAIQAYGAGLSVGGPAAPIIAAAFAAMATAAGMLQIAALKKQQQAQEAGYYGGGFTGGKQYKKEAGVVHEGEFVANHQAVNNPNVLPFLNFLDQAQRNNTVGSLTAEDVSRSMGAGGSSQIVTPIVNVQTDNEELRDAVDAHREATDRLIARLNIPIDARVVLTGTDGLNAQQELLDRMLKNK